MIDERLKPVLKEVCERLTKKHCISPSMPEQICDDDIEYYSWPCAFGSTAGPTGRIGGQMITNFQIHGFLNTLCGDGYLFCAGKYRYVSKFVPLMNWGA